MIRAILTAVLLFAHTVCGADFNNAVAKALASATPARSSVAGAESPWRFVVKELAHLSKGDLAQAENLAALNAEGTDPLPVIQEYAAVLKSLGVDLCLVPVPPKAVIYPDKLASDLAPSGAPGLKAFLDKIAAFGIQVVEL